MPWQCSSEIAIAGLEFLAHYSTVGQTDGLCFPSPSFPLYNYFFLDLLTEATQKLLYRYLLSQRK